MRNEHDIRTRLMIGAGLLATIGLGSTLSPYLCGPCLTGALARADSPPDERRSASSVTLLVEGMTCGACGVTVRVAAKKLDGVKEVRVNVAGKQAVVAYDPKKVTPDQILEAVTKTGLKASLAPK